MKKLLLTATAIVAFSASAHAAGNTASAQAEATAHVVRPITLTVNQDASFGSFSVSDTAGTITTAGVVTGGVVQVPGTSNPTKSIQVTVTGEEDTAYGIYVDGSDVMVGAGPAPSVNLVHATDTSAAPMVATLTSFTGSNFLSGGQDVITTTGVLAVNANQTPGEYKAEIDLVATYQ